MKSELQIWNNIKSGDISALRELYLLYYQALFNYGKKMTTDQHLIEDAIQETYLSLWKYRITTAVPAAVKQYVFKTFRNQLVRLLKQQTAVEITDDNLDFRFEISFDNKMVEGEDARLLSQEINKAVALLTPRQREIVYHRFYEGHSFEEIAAIMNMQTRATYKLAARALAALKTFLRTTQLTRFSFL